MNMDATISAEPKFRLSGFRNANYFLAFRDVRIHVYCGLTHWYFYPPRRIDIRSFGMLEPTTRHNYRFVHIGI